MARCFDVSEPEFSSFVVEWVARAAFLGWLIFVLFALFGSPKPDSDKETAPTAERRAGPSRDPRRPAGARHD